MTIEDANHPRLGSPAGWGTRAIEKRLNAFRQLGWAPGGRLLDVGCGNGAYTVEMAEDFDETVAIDVATEWLAEFRAQLAGTPAAAKIEVLEQSVTSLPYPDEHFDTVSAIEVIEHIDDLGAGLSEIRRVLRPGGRFFITCPNRLFPIETHAVVVGSHSISGRWTPFLPWVPPLHTRMSTARTFTMHGLRNLLRESGFRDEVHTWVMPPFDKLPGGQRLRPAADRLEQLPGARAFGVSIVMAVSKPL